jgi:xylan 1,4-beta-xylosidase
MTGLPLRDGAARVRRFLIDDEHSNAFTVWQSMGSPQQPTREQFKRLEKAGQLAYIGKSESVGVKDGNATLQLRLPRKAVSLLMLEWGAGGYREK